MIDTNTNICLGCNEKVTDPICPFCIVREMESWLKEGDENVVKKVREIKGLLKHDTDSGECIICHYNSVYKCPQCFSELVYNKLKNVGKETRLEFLTLFNFRSNNLIEEKIKLEEAIR